MAWIVTGGPGPVLGNDDEGLPWVCPICGFATTTSGRMEKHAITVHPLRAVRIEQRGLIP